MCRVNSYNEEKLDFTTTRLLPSPCAWWLSLPHAVDGHVAVESCRSSNIIVRLLEEAKIQAQPEHGSCERSCGSLCVGVGRGAEPWSTHIARLLHETKLLCEPTIVLVRTTTC